MQKPARQFFEERLIMRTRRFAQCVEMKAPGVILANELILVMDALLALDTKVAATFGEKMFTRMGQSYRNLCEYCALCDEPVWAEGQRFCAEHSKQEEYNPKEGERGLEKEDDEY